MQATIIQRSRNSFKIEIEVPYIHNMLEAEEHLQKTLNVAGCLGTEELLSQFDTDGSPISMAGIKLTAKGNAKESKSFQSPYGECVVERFVYQSSQGGKTYIPMENGARIIGTSTPKFAKMVASKYSCDGAPGVQRDLAENHNRPVVVSFIKNLTDLVGTIAEIKETKWSYTIPTLPRPVKCISIGLDGTCLNMKEDGWREAMCGTIALFDKDGERMHTIYTAAAPEYGKEKFLNRFEREVEKVKTLFPKETIVGLADGASSNWPILEKHADILTLDFWHFTEYLGKAAGVMFPLKEDLNSKTEWMNDTCHKAKHNEGGVSCILKELQEFSDNTPLAPEKRQILNQVITYMRNHQHIMHYYKNVEKNIPIGSGVTEAACKSLVKFRMCKGSARWNNKGAATVLHLRSIHSTKERWDQFWDKYAQYGCMSA